MKRIWANIRIFLHYLFAGMVSADKEISNGEKNSSASDGVGIEQKKEVDRDLSAHQSSHVSTCIMFWFGGLKK